LSGQPRFKISDACFKNLFPVHQLLFPFLPLGIMTPLGGRQPAGEFLVVVEQVPFGPLQGGNALVQTAVLLHELVGGIWRAY
jgi:hypothetical protein